MLHVYFVCRLEGDLVKAIVSKASKLANKLLVLDVCEYVVSVEEVCNIENSLYTKTTQTNIKSTGLIREWIFSVNVVCSF